jgi:hypothetical protein
LLTKASASVFDDIISAASVDLDQVPPASMHERVVVVHVMAYLEAEDGVEVVAVRRPVDVDRVLGSFSELLVVPQDERGLEELVGPASVLMPSKESLFTKLSWRVLKQHSTPPFPWWL